MPSFDRLREFLLVAEIGSISGAARKLGLPRATLSRRISGLETDLGVRLILRRTTHLTLTQAGEELRRRAVRIVADADAAWGAVRRLDETPRGLLRVSVTGAFFAALYSDFLKDFPEVRIEVQSTTRHVDLLAEGVDVAMRIGEVRDPNLIARRVQTDRLIAVASPLYLAEHDMPKRAEDLSAHSCILGFAGDWAPLRQWPLLDGGKVAVNGRMAANEIELLIHACLSGLGIGLLPSALAAEHIETGDLQIVLPDKVGAEIPMSLVYADREFIDPKVRVFVDRAVESIRREMPQPYLQT
ncbi:MAG: LysR family transcriptional regulator [Paracoccaceae bacterium]